MPRVDAERSWIALHPDWYRSERARMSRRFPGFRVSEAALTRGILAYAGEISIDLGREKRTHNVVLIYSNETPFSAPLSYPVLSLRSPRSLR